MTNAFLPRLPIITLTILISLFCTGCGSWRTSHHDHAVPIVVPLNVPEDSKTVDLSIHLDPTSTNTYLKHRATEQIKGRLLNAGYIINEVKHNSPPASHPRMRCTLNDQSSYGGLRASVFLFGAIPGYGKTHIIINCEASMKKHSTITQQEVIVKRLCWLPLFWLHFTTEDHHKLTKDGLGLAANTLVSQLQKQNILFTPDMTIPADGEAIEE